MTQLPQQARASVDSRQNEPTALPLEYLAKLAYDMEANHRHGYGHRIDALERILEARLATLRSLIDSQAEKVVLALDAADKAVLKAEAATEKRFESVNEFRGTLSDQTKNFVTKIEFDALRDSNSARIADLSSRLDRTEGKAAGLNASWLYLLGGLSAIGTVVSVVIAVLLGKR